MTDNRTITWAFKIADNVTEGADEAAAAAEKAGKQTDEAKAKQEELKNTVDKTTAGITAQQARLAMQVTVIVGLQGAVSGLTSGIKALGITSDATNEKLTKINAAFQIMGGLANTVKALQLAMSMLNLATVKNALLNTYNAVVSNPAAIALRRGCRRGCHCGGYPGCTVGKFEHFNHQHYGQRHIERRDRIDCPGCLYTGAGDGVKQCRA